jgi:hypothetical protein
MTPVGEEMVTATVGCGRTIEYSGLPLEIEGDVDLDLEADPDLDLEAGPETTLGVRCR